ncbi:MAG: class I SAM-dependent methyltransferase [Candidatus Ozemobacteraceae bacterium]
MYNHRRQLVGPAVYADAWKSVLTVATSHALYRIACAHSNKFIPFLQANPEREDYMEFYTSIAPFYDRIFPFDEDLPTFIMGLAGGQTKKILDIGCATGHLPNALAKRGNEVVGIDLDPEMVRLAKGRFQNTHCSFQVADMTWLDRHFLPETFDMVCCFGNTLVHLPDRKSITATLRQARLLLRPEGLLIGQIIHYDRILDGRLEGLPTIVRKGLRFERKYLYRDGDPLISFQTSLTLEGCSEPVINTVPLYPIRAEELAQCILDAGFGPVEFCADTDRTTLDASSVALYFVACVDPAATIRET